LNPDPTYPHDYRIIAGSEAKPTIVGGQAVNLWAITFLEPGDPHLTTKYASGDLDVLSTPKILNFLKSLEPAWRVDKIPFWAFGDGRDLDQVGPPERHDRSHLQLVTRFFPLYLRHIHRSAIENPATQNAAAGVFSRAFETLNHRPTAKTLATEAIDRATLMPPEFAESPNEKIRNAYKWQFPKLQSEP
jgi:hypothetical protein